MLYKDRIISTISPRVEISLAENPNDETLHTFFHDSVKLFSRFKHLTIFLIPNQLKSLFYLNPILRMILDLTLDPQSNILFETFNQPCHCKKIHPFSVFPGNPNSYEVSRAVTVLLCLNDVPVLIDKVGDRITKAGCSDCESALLCSQELELG